MKKQYIIIGALVVLVSVGVIWLSAPHESRTSTDVTMMQPGASMGGMMTQSQISNEKYFIEMMVPHHEEAIATAGEVLERGGTTPDMRALAENIISSQTDEVALMKTKYEEWFDTPYQPTGEYQPMMRELADLNGAALDSVFLHDMTMHHMGAIMMARSLRPHLEHEEMDELTRNIITNQSREIQVMREISAEIN